MINLIKGLGRSVTDALEPALATFGRDMDLLEGVMAAAAMVAAADGEVEQQERAKIGRFLETHELMRHFDRSKAITLFARYVQELTFDLDMGGDTCLSQIREVKGAEKRLLIVRLALAIAKADGELEPAEEVAVTKIVDALNLNRADFGLA